MRRCWCGVFLLVLFASVANPGTALAVKSKFYYEVPDDNGADGPTIAVTFENARPEEEGGDDPAEVGIVRSTVGIPYRIKSKGTDVSKTVPQFFADALRSSGYNAAVGEQAGEPRVHVVLEKLWCDGHTHYVAVMEATLQLFVPGATDPSWEGSVSGEGHVTLVISHAEMQEAYEEMFAEALTKLPALWAGDAFHTAMAGQSGPLVADPVRTDAVQVEPASDSNRPDPSPYEPAKGALFTLTTGPNLGFGEAMSSRSNPGINIVGDLVGGIKVGARSKLRLGGFSEYTLFFGNPGGMGVYTIGFIAKPTVWLGGKCLSVTEIGAGYDTPVIRRIG